MNSLEIRCFLLTASLKSYTKAAEKLFLSQPTISRYVSKLEQELGCRLLDRTTQKIQLTEAGEQYYRLFLSWKMDLAETKKRVQRIENVERCVILLGYYEGWGLPEEVHQFFSSFEARYPMIEITVQCMSPKECISALVKDELDMLLIIEHPDLNNVLFSKKVITTVNKVIAYSKRHRFSMRDIVYPRDFRDEKFYVLDENVDYVIQKTREYCAEYQFVPNIQKEKNIQTIHTNVLSGRGVTITDNWGPVCDKEDYRTCQISSKENVYLVWKNENLKRAFELFIEEFEL